MRQHLNGDIARRGRALVALTASLAVAGCGSSAPAKHSAPPGDDSAAARDAAAAFSRDGNCSLLTANARKELSGETDQAKCQHVLDLGSKPPTFRISSTSITGDAAKLSASAGGNGYSIREIKQGGHWLIDDVTKGGSAGAASGQSTTSAAPPSDRARARAQFAAARAAANAGTSTFKRRFKSDAAAHNLPALKADLSQLRDVIFNFDGAIRKISFPSASRTNFTTVLESDRTAIADLDALAATQTSTELGRLLTTHLAPDLKALGAAEHKLRTGL